MKDAAKVAFLNAGKSEDAERYILKVASLQCLLKGKESTLRKLKSQIKESDAHLLEATSRMTDIKGRIDEVQDAISKKQGRLKALSGHQRRRLVFNPNRFISKSEAMITYEVDYTFILTPCALCYELFPKKDVIMASCECLYHP